MTSCDRYDLMMKQGKISKINDTLVKSKALLKGIKNNKLKLKQELIESIDKLIESMSFLFYLLRYITLHSLYILEEIHYQQMILRKLIF